MFYLISSLRINYNTLLGTDCRPMVHINHIQDILSIEKIEGLYRMSDSRPSLKVVYRIEKCGAFEWDKEKMSYLAGG